MWAAFDRLSPYLIEERPDAEERPTLSPPGRRAYVVQALTWQYNDNWYDVANDEPLKAFVDRQAVETYRTSLEHTARAQRGSPRRMVASLEQATSQSPDSLRFGLESLGVAPPTDLLDLVYGDDDWWYNLRERSMERWHAAWDLFDRLRFFELIEIDLDTTPQTPVP
jgi:hypothetical protein